MQVVKINHLQGNLVYQLFDNYRVFYKQPSNFELAQKFIQARLDNNESVIFVVLTDDLATPVAFTQLYPRYSSARAVKNWILNDLYVEEGYRKQGIGALLIKQAMQFARESGAVFVELSTAIDNYTAQSLYEQIGFVQQEPEKDFYTYRISL